jgi:hypothetical protein
VRTENLNQRPQIRIDLQPASEGSGFPSPVPAKAGSMPTQEGLGPDDRDRIQYWRETPIQMDQEQAIACV